MALRSSSSRLDRLLAYSRAALAFESVWRVLSWGGGAAALFAALAWFGLLQPLPGFARAGVFAACVALAAYGAVREARWPARARALARLDGDAAARSPGLATSLTDVQAGGVGDAGTQALWRAHRARLERALAAVRVSPPRPNMAQRDRRALRVGACLLAAVAALAAGDERRARLAGAFAWDDGGPARSVRIDVWLDPPAYTGRAPIVAAGETARPSPDPIAAPAGSTLVVRVSPADSAAVAVSGGLEPTPAQSSAATPRADPARRFTLTGAATLEIDAGRFARTQRIALTAIPDTPPAIALVEQPRPNARGSLTLSYVTADDYGATSAEAAFDAPERDDAVADAPLYGPPTAPLTLSPGGVGPARATLDLGDHPWAGGRARLTLRARDAAGGEGTSTPIHIQLPQRAFAQPLARALVEQRRILALTPRDKDQVLGGLAALMLSPGPEMTAAAYLGVRTAFARLKHARDDEGLRDVAAYLWQIALAIDGGDLGEIERAMRAAMDRLHAALQNGAPPEEIARLTADMRETIDKLLQAMADRHKATGEGEAAPPAGDAGAVAPEALQDMARRLEDTARQGATAEARAMLDQLQDVLENLRAGGGAPSAEQRAMARAQRDLDALTREQQKLRDETFADRPDPDGRRADETDDKDGGMNGGDSAGQTAPGNRARGEDRAGREKRRDENADAVTGDAPDGPPKGTEPQPGAAPHAALGARQKALRERLDRLREALGENGGKALADAGNAMREAERQLGRRSRGAASEAQGRAVDALRKASNALAEQARQRNPSADGPAPGETDPLGRQKGQIDDRARYDPLGQSPALRAQRVLEELRRRLGEPSRPAAERDYLERLLRRY